MNAAKSRTSRNMWALPAIVLCLAWVTAMAAQQEPPPTASAQAPGTAPAAAKQETPPAAPPEAPVGEAPAAPAKKVVRTFKLYADNWSWTPDTIRVKQGDHVVLKLFAYQASRSFYLKAYKLNAHMPQDEEVTVEFDATKPGEFRWKCGRPCGDGCAKMRGTLFVD